MNRVWKLLILIFTIIILDQLTKAAVQSNFSLGESITIIPDFFNFTYVRNPGAAFGFLADAHDNIRKPLFLLVPVIACFWLVYLIWTTRKGPIVLSLAYSLILAGAIGNLWDRFTLDYVVDFLDFHMGGKHFPAFNIADSSISIAASLLIYDFFVQLKEEKMKKSKKG